MAQHLQFGSFTSEDNEMKTRRLTPLAREIALLLLIKLCLIIAIKVAFFSNPVKPGSDGTAANLLAITPERTTHHE